jgi:PEGA domain-containing protein
MRPFTPLALVIATTTAAHAGKPKLLVLGVEPADKTADTQVKAARDITLALRSQAKAPNPYLLAPDDKPLADARTKHKCDSEEPDCMLAIASEAKAEAIAWGHLDGDTITLKAIRAGKHDIIVVSGALPTGDASDWVKTAYQTLLVPSGSLAVKANVPSATVSIDGAPKVPLTDRAIVLPEGQHKIRVEAAGYAPLATTVAIKEGEEATLSVELVATK